MINKSAMRELKSLLMKKHSEHIDKIILFGSQVNGTAQEYSDYDILLILKKSFDWRFENEIYDTCFDVNLKYDILVDIKLISKQELQTLKGKQPFIQNALAYGLTI